MDARRKKNTRDCARLQLGIMKRMLGRRGPSPFEAAWPLLEL
jgi:hypothetical protein